MGMSYLLDTNAWAQYLNRRDSRVARQVERTEALEIQLCSVVKAELYFGAYKSPRRDANLALLAQVFAQFVSIPFDDAAADVYGQIRSYLERRGTPIGPNDLMIAAIAKANDLTLVTHNTDEFGRVPGLKIEDWESDTRESPPS
jgi:tRNA(fMet)-specific endonuclease VapC